MEVTEFRRTAGDTLTLRMTLINESDGVLNFSALADQRYDITGSGHAIGGIHLLDPLGRRKYFVARDSANKCVSSAGLVNLAHGRSLNVWAKFAAPPTEVERITIVIPTFLPIEDVPISR